MERPWRAGPLDDVVAVLITALSPVWAMTRDQNVAEAGGHPDSIATLSDELAYLRYDVSGGDPFLTRQYAFDGGDIENRWDYASRPRV